MVEYMINEAQRKDIVSMFEYDPYLEKDILKRATEAEHHSIQVLLDNSPIPVKTTTKFNKGQIGNFIEENWFGIPNNSSQVPDFAEAGIELKVIPLYKTKANRYSIKERTKVTSINFNTIIDEIWNTSHAKIKLNKILFVFYHYVVKETDNKSVDLSSSKVVKTSLWELKGNDEYIIKKDWSTVQDKVKEGLAHELSETLSKVLAASRSGSGGKNKDGILRDLVEQPNKQFEQKALRRAFSLKSSFTQQYWDELSKKKHFESIIDLLNVSPDEDFENILLKKLHEFKDMKIQDVANSFSIKISNSKDAVSSIIKKAIGFKDIKSEIKEFEQLGIQIKTIPVRPTDNYPWESTSFPAMKLKEFVEEDWDSSIFSTYVQKILFVPIYRDERKASESPIGERIIGKAFYWSPSLYEVHTIKKEWNEYKKEVLDGKAQTHSVKQKSRTIHVSDLSKESETNIIHMRPHGQVNKDRDTDHLGNSIVKQCFWLNKSFIQKLLQKEK